MTKVHWRKWYPQIEYSDDVKLSDVLATLPGNDPNEISWIVKLIENPESKWALPGAISLFEHDVVHILLGRGLLPQDEAFVIGFTMGNASGLRMYHTMIFKFFARFLYPKIYRFTKDQLKIFDLGVKYGKSRMFKNIHEVDMIEDVNETINSLKKKYYIDTDKLKEIMKEEIKIIPDSKVTERLKEQLDV